MKRLLVVVDFQNDFVDGAFPYPQASTFLPRIENLLKDYKDNQDDVVFLKNEHDANYLHSEEGHHLPTIHCLKGTRGAELVKPLDEYAQDNTVLIHEGVGCPELFHFLEKRSREYRVITLVGLSLEEEVLADAAMVKSLSNHTLVRVDTSCTGTLEEDKTKDTIACLKNLQIETGDFLVEKRGVLD